MGASMAIEKIQDRTWRNRESSSTVWSDYGKYESFSNDSLVSYVSPTSNGDAV